MANLASLYTQISTGSSRSEKPPQPEDAARTQLRINWQNSTVTQEFLNKLSSAAVALEEQARLAACSFPQHKNYDSIINMLVRADQLRKVIEDASS